jgi:hypothetical protein
MTYIHWHTELDKNGIFYAYLDKKDASTNSLNQAVLTELAHIV